MFTDQEYQTVIDDIETSSKQIYSVQKNAYSYYLRQLENDKRGEAAEKLVANRLKFTVWMHTILAEKIHSI